jgi:hypothetical protein
LRKVVMNTHPALCIRSVVVYRCVGDHEEPLKSRVAAVVGRVRPWALGHENLVARELPDVLADNGEGRRERRAPERTGR